jgi:hypothetical protein
MQNLSIMLAVSAIILFPAFVHAQNLLANEDFSGGNQDFSSGYSFVSSGTSTTAGTYGIRTSSQDFNPGYVSFGDHTTGTGNMMLVDGSTTANTVVWSETVSVTNNAQYAFSGWATASDSANVPTLRFFINGIQAGPDVTLSTAAGQWQQFFMVWNSGATNSATLSIVDENLIALGNDFALDDLSFSSSVDTKFTYQGRLNDGANPAGGSYDLTFTLYAVASGGTAIAGPLTNSATAVSNGLFTVTLDFGDQFPGADRWLEIGVRTNGGTTFATLAPRQPVTPAPYAIYSANAGNATTATTAANLSGSVSAAQISGSVASANLSGAYSNPVTLNNAGNSFSGNGAGLTSLDADNLSSGTVADALLSANVGLLDANQTFTGQNTFSIPVAVDNITPPSSSLTVAGDFELAGGAAYHHLELSGGNSLGFLYGSYPHFGDGIHFGYNYYADASGSNQIIHPDGGTSRISVGYGSIALATADAGQGEPVDRLSVTSDGDVIVNTTLHPNGGINTSADSFLGDIVANGDMGVDDDLYVEGYGNFDKDLTVYGSVFVDTNLTIYGNAYKPGGGSWSSTSDERLKKNIQPLTGVLDKLLALRGVSFEYKDPEKIHELPGERIGMIAQEVEKVFPDWVSTGADGYKRLTYRGFEALTVEALRELRAEQDAKIATLEKQNAEMEKQLAEQKKTNAQTEARLDQLEKAVARVTVKSDARFAFNSKATENK